jgi:Tfp pilus assembly protein PilF
MGLNEDNDAALADASHAIVIDPLNARAFRVRSIIYRALDKLDMAALDRRRADELGESRPALSDSEDDEGE